MGINPKLKVSNDNLKVSEIFATIQGEGVTTGLPSVFIRLNLCNLKCIWCDSLAEGTLVLTDQQGWVPIEKIETGATILGVEKETGHPLQDRWFYTQAAATAKRKHFAQGALEITTYLKNKIVCTLNHEFLVRRRSGKYLNYQQSKQWTWTSAGDLKLGDILWGVGSPVNSPRESPDYVQGWLSGYDRGDGGWANSTKRTRRYESVLSEISDRQCEYFKRLQVKHFRRTRLIKTGILHQVDSYYIPSAVTKPSKEYMRGFVAGLYDAEGSTNYMNASFYNDNISLLKQCSDFLQSFDFATRLKKKKKGGNPRATNTLEVIGGGLPRLRFDAIFQYAKTSQREKWLWNGKGRRGAASRPNHQMKQKVSVTSIRKLQGTFQFYDIGSSCGNFVANGVVVHNTPHTWNWIGTNFEHRDQITGENIKYDPEKEIIEMTSEQILAKVTQLAGDNIHTIVITGGEPLMQNRSAAFLELFQSLKEKGFRIEVESNGTIVPIPEVERYVDQFNLSPKLENSGNKLNQMVNPKAYEYFVQSPKSWFKFVVMSKQDLEEIEKLIDRFKIPSNKILIMPEGRSNEEISKRAKELVELCKEKGWRYCNRLQVQIWDKDLRGV